MTDNEIIQALECHISSDANCFDCPADEYGCIDPLIIGAYNLIKRQQAEIERLKGELATDKNDGCKWIPVTERLPEKNEIVLVYCKNKTIQGGVTRHIGSCDNGFWFLKTQPGTASFPHLEWEVTHWMPLPEPPKGE